MKSRIIKNEPPEPDGPRAAGAHAEPRPKRNFAATVGGWSARHWKTAVFAWLAFVAVSMFLSQSIGTVFIDQNDVNVGEARKADRLIDEAGFTLNEKGESIEELGEMVLIQSKTETAADAAFRAVVRDVEQTLRGFPKAT